MELDTLEQKINACCILYFHDYVNVSKSTLALKYNTLPKQIIINLKSRIFVRVYHKIEGVSVIEMFTSV